MSIKSLKKTWDFLGKTDPLWAILTAPDKKGNKWELEEFFRTGGVEVRGVLEYIASLGFNLPRGKALDFGCGVGRLTQALAPHFDEVDGVDISPSMIALAEKYNRHAGRCKYYLNDRDSLALFQDHEFAFIYSNITLQHMEPRYSKKYLKECLRVLAPGGLLVFQLPSHPREPQTGHRGFRQRIKRLVPPSLIHLVRSIKGPRQAIIEMHSILREELARFLTQQGGTILDISPDPYAGEEWVSFRYCVTRK